VMPTAACRIPSWKHWQFQHRPIRVLRGSRAQLTRFLFKPQVRYPAIEEAQGHARGEASSDPIRCQRPSSC
jgi:hypothetical protein